MESSMKFEKIIRINHYRVSIFYKCSKIMHDKLYRYTPPRESNCFPLRSSWFRFSAARRVQFCLRSPARKWNYKCEWHNIKVFLYYHWYILEKQSFRIGTLQRKIAVHAIELTTPNSFSHRKHKVLHLNDRRNRESRMTRDDEISPCV